jgi:hypothetical protein
MAASGTRDFRSPANTAWSVSNRKEVTLWFNMSVTVSKVGSTLSVVLSLVAALHAQTKPPDRVVLKVDEIVSGPFGGQKSSSCLRVHSNGNVIYARSWSSAVTVVDSATSVASRPEHMLAVADQLVDTDVLEIVRLLESKAVRRLPERFSPPHKPVDYFEVVSLEILDGRGNSKKLVTSEYYVADLEEKTRYPSALIVLMDRIDQIEKAATSKGKPTEIPADCSLKGGERLAK